MKKEQAKKLKSIHSTNQKTYERLTKKQHIGRELELWGHLTSLELELWGHLTSLELKLKEARRKIRRLERLLVQRVPARLRAAGAR